MPHKLAQEVFSAHYPVAAQYANILSTTGLEWGLIGPKEVERIWQRHILNCVAISDLLPEGAKVIDVGSGAGLPGIPLAILRPDLQFTLLEPLERRCTFLNQTIAQLDRLYLDLDLDDNVNANIRADLSRRVRVIRGRAEEHSETYDAVTCRAVANVKQLVAWTRHLITDGAIVCLKGQNVDAEIAAATKVLRKSRLDASVQIVRAHQEAEITRALILRPY